MSGASQRRRCVDQTADPGHESTRVRHSPGACRPGHAVADTALGKDVDGFVRDIAELAPEACDEASQGYCQVDEKFVDRPPRYWARASREPAMLGIRNGRQPQLDNTSGKGVTAVGTVTPAGRSAAPPRGYSNPHFASVSLQPCYADRPDHPSHGTRLSNRMDGPHVQPVVGLHQGFSGMRPLLRGNLGKAHGLRCLGRRCSAAAPRRRLLEPAAPLGSGRRAVRTAGACVLRVDGGRVRMGPSLRQPSGAIVDAHREHT